MTSLEAREAPPFQRAPWEVHPHERPTSDGLVIRFGDQECPAGAKKWVMDDRPGDGDDYCLLCGETLCPCRVCGMTSMIAVRKMSTERHKQQQNRNDAWVVRHVWGLHVPAGYFPNLFDHGWYSTVAIFLCRETLMSFFLLLEIPLHHEVVLNGRHVGGAS